MKNLLLVGLGGFFGSVLRYSMYLLIDKRFLTSFPLATFSVNVIGSLILGIVIGLSLKGTFSEPMRLLLAVGVCGSFTTFSTFAMENLNLINQKETAVLFIYTTLSIFIGISAAWIGQWLVK